MVNPSYQDMAVTLLLFGLVLVLSVRERLGLEKTFIHASIRTVVQLSLVGYLIEYIFRLDRWYFVLALLLGMSLIAAREGAKRIPSKLPYLTSLVWLAVFAGTIIDTVIVTEAILKIDPWWNPRYLLPLAGMIMGNALNSGSLVGERFLSELKNRKAEVETLLILGLPSSEACHELKRSAIRNALIPTFNAMFTVGLVHLPGMMTGQILGGSSPIVAAKYQIIVMFMISSTVVITALIMLALLSKRYFTPAHQLRYEQL